MRSFIVAVLALGALALPSQAAAASYVSQGTAQLLTKKIQRKLEHSHPSHTYTRSSTCARRTRWHVDCRIVDRWKDEDGIREMVIFTVHVRTTSTGYAAAATRSGPVEDQVIVGEGSP